METIRKHLRNKDPVMQRVFDAASHPIPASQLLFSTVPEPPAADSLPPRTECPPASETFQGMSDHKCVACTERGVSMTATPCGHLVLCHACALRLCAQAPVAKCPMCRTDVVKFQGTRVST